jgi:hypothetical protein
MENFIIEEMGRLVKEYNKTKDPKVLSELKQFVDHVSNILTI